MNTPTLVQKMIDEGKAKIGKCERKDCKNEHDLLYRVKGTFICDECLDSFEKIMEGLGMIK